MLIFLKPSLTDRVTFCRFACICLVFHFIKQTYKYLWKLFVCCFVTVVVTLFVNVFSHCAVMHAGLYCCDRAATHCQMACRQILRTMSTEHEIMEGLIKECGSQPLPQEPMWQCFLSSVQTPSITPEDNLPAKMDCAKLHCCSKANTSLCRYDTVGLDISGRQCLGVIYSEQR